MLQQFDWKLIAPLIRRAAYGATSESTWIIVAEIGGSANRTSVEATLCGLEGQGIVSSVVGYVSEPNKACPSRPT